MAPNVKVLNIGTGDFDFYVLNIYDYIPAGVEHLYVGPNTEYLSLPQFVKMMGRLTQLKYLAPPRVGDLVPEDSGNKGKVNWEGVVWPNIRELVFDEPYGMDGADEFGQLIPSGVFSCLDRLSFNGVLDEDEFVRFIQAHGKPLKALAMAIYDPDDGIMPTTAMLIAVGKFCPGLEEISLIVTSPLEDDDQHVDWPMADIIFPLVTTLGLRFVEDTEAGEDSWEWFLNNTLRWMKMLPNLRTVRFFDEQNLDWLQSPDAADQFGRFVDGCNESGVTLVEDNSGNQLTPYHSGPEV